MSRALPGLHGLSLTEGEQLIYIARPHWRTLARPLGLSAVLTAGVFFAMGLITGSQSLAGFNLEPVSYVLLVLWVVLMIARFIVPFVQWRQTRLIITTDRIIATQGGRAKHRSTLRGSHIHQLAVRRHGLDSVFGSGQVHIAGLDGRFAFTGVPRRKELEAALAQLHYAPRVQQG